MKTQVKIIFEKILRRLNRWLPDSWRKQVGVQITYNEHYFQHSYRYLSDEQIARFCEGIVSILKPKSAIDLGCGLGMYLRELKRMGLKVVGFDASLYAVQAVDPEVPVFVADLSKPFRTNQKYDIALCFEVAEHLPKRSSGVLVASLCHLSDTVLFTAAPPGQPGIDHINLQPKTFWISLFNRNGFVYDGTLTQQFVVLLQRVGAPEWFCRNFSVFRRAGDESKPQDL